jgi:hypothetical protein
MTGESENRLWDSIEEIRENISQIKELLAGHIHNEAIHQRSPCPNLKNLGERLWAIGFAAIGALLAAAWNLLRDRP